MKRSNPFGQGKKTSNRSVFGKSTKGKEIIDDDDSSSSSSSSGDALSENTIKRQKTNNSFSGGKRVQKISNVTIEKTSLTTNDSTSLTERQNELAVSEMSSKILNNDQQENTSVSKVTRKRQTNEYDEALAILDSLSSKDASSKNKDGNISHNKQNSENLTDKITFSTVKVFNINPKMTEERVEELFQRCGKIHLVKIVWPRTADEMAANSNRGYVTYYERESAYDAINMFHNMTYENHVLKVFWAEDQSKVTLSTPGSNTEFQSKASDPSSFSGDLNGSNMNIIRVHPVMPVSMKDNKNVDQGKDLEYESNVSLHKTNTEEILESTLDSSAEGEIIIVDTIDNTHYIPPSLPPVFIAFPERIDQLYLINRVAQYVVKDGSPFEQRLMNKERHNQEYDFLRNHSSPEGLFYRWKVYENLMEENNSSWREIPFQMTVGGPMWYPPQKTQVFEKKSSETSKKKEGESPTAGEGDTEKVLTKDFCHKDGDVEAHSLGTGKDIEATNWKIKTGREKEIEREKKRLGGNLSYLPREDYILLVSNLRNLRLSRSQIQKCMILAFDNQEACEDVVATISKYIIDKKNLLPLATRLAILYLIHDILWNSLKLGSNVKSASRYADKFQKILPEIMESLNSTIKQTEYGRLTLQTIERKVLLLFRLWNSWSLFSELFIDGLHATFLQKPEDLEWDKVDDLDEAKLDYDHLYRKAKNAGLVVEVNNQKCGSKNLLRKLNYLNNFVNAKRRNEDDSIDSTL